MTIAKAELNDGQRLYAVNDLFVGVRSHISARYTISVGKESEQHSSSGIIVSTGLGSTGWFRSLMTGAAKVASEASGGRVKVEPPGGFAWDSDYLYYTVREPFPSKTSSATLVFGKITSARPLKLISQTPEVGVIFSDGIEKRLRSVQLGDSGNDHGRREARAPSDLIGGPSGCAVDLEG